MRLERFLSTTSRIANLENLCLDPARPRVLGSIVTISAEWWKDISKMSVFGAPSTTCAGALPQTQFHRESAYTLSPSGLATGTKLSRDRMATSRPTLEKSTKSSGEPHIKASLSKG